MSALPLVNPGFRGPGSRRMFMSRGGLPVCRRAGRRGGPRRMRARVVWPLLAVRHHAGPRHLSARPPTAAANRPSTRFWPGICKPFSSTPERPSTDCRSMSRRRCGPTSNAAFWPTDSCGPVVRTAGRAGRLPFPARSGGSSPRAAAGVWGRYGGASGRRGAAPGARYANGCSAFLTRCATASPTTASWSRGYVHVLMLDGVNVRGRSSGFPSGPAVVRPGRAADRADECASHHPPVHQTRLARRSRSTRGGGLWWPP